jgi:hypothetical protein
MACVCGCWCNRECVRAFAKHAFSQHHACCRAVCALAKAARSRFAQAPAGTLSSSQQQFAGLSGLSSDSLGLPWTTSPPPTLSQKRAYDMSRSLNERRNTLHNVIDGSQAAHGSQVSQEPPVPDGSSSFTTSQQNLMLQQSSLPQPALHSSALVATPAGSAVATGTATGPFRQMQQATGMPAAAVSLLQQAPAKAQAGQQQ